MFDFTEAETLKMENTISSQIPFDNAYFMSVYTTCKEVLSDLPGRNEALARVCAGLDFCKVAGNFMSEQFALLALLDVDVDEKKLEPLATTKNTVINGLNYTKQNSVGIVQPTKYAGKLVNILKEGMKELFIAHMCDLIAIGNYLINHPTVIEIKNKYSLAVSIAYIDTLLDMSNLHLEGNLFEARNRFGIVAGKLRKEFDI